MAIHNLTWLPVLTLKQLIPGLSKTLHDLQKAQAQAYAAEVSAKNKITASINTAINNLQNVINSANLLVNNISKNLDDTGVNMLLIPSNTGGYNQLSSDILTANNKPILPVSGTYAGVLLVVTAPDFTQCNSFYAKLQNVFNGVIQ